MTGVRPQIGHITLLVYRECPCGDWIATAEGALAPICPHCGNRYVPGGGPQNGEPVYGRSHEEARAMRGLGFVGFLTNEIQGVKLVHSLKKHLGLISSFGDMVEDRQPGEDGCHYSQSERAASYEIDAALDGKAAP